MKKYIEQIFQVPEVIESRRDLYYIQRYTYIINLVRIVIQFLRYWDHGSTNQAIYSRRYSSTFEVQHHPRYFTVSN